MPARGSNAQGDPHHPEDQQVLAVTIYDAAFEVELKNAKKGTITVSVLEPIPGDWGVLEQSHPHTKEAAGTAKFRVPVPAEGSTKLTYKVRVKW